ncbi:chalcone isomerase family protein [Glaciecola siphonariae]|uniref:Chalcone isomerase family protein n=1 Tax=Glaciecola siphonariae TaxID=521012 RepID=A0ABV9LVQ5_9ALTE
MQAVSVLISILLTVGSVVFSNSAYAVSNYIENPKPVGEARLEIMFWDIYDAKLIAPNGDFHPEKPFALALTYLREFEGKNIASRSIDEMRDQGMKDEVKLAKWFEKMQQVFPNVDEGQTLTGIVDDKQHSHFYFNDNKMGTIEDPEFTKWFFNIWLSEDTSQPKLRQKLLGSVN